MIAYFKLQTKLVNRRLIAFGLPLLVAYTILPVLFFYASDHLFDKTEYAFYIYIVLALSFASKLGDVKRNLFLTEVII